MNMTKWIMICLLAMALAPVGCSKQEYPKAGQQQAVTIDVPKLKSAFATASPELKALSDQAIGNIQYGRSYSQGLTQLDQLANAPGVTEDQKKVVAEVTDQVKKIMGAGAASPAQ
jgi:hypothetical protein